MSIINFEIEEVSKICENVIQNSKIIVCNDTLIRINIEQTKFRQITICLRFPDNYPQQSILIELKSRTLSEKFLEGLTNICEQKLKEYFGKPQVLLLLKFIAQYLIENPLCIVFDEILSLKSIINGTVSELKLKQKTSSVILVARGDKYYFKIKTEIPEEYPEKCITWETYESNLPNVLTRYLNGQAKEIARQCVEPPLRKLKDKSKSTTVKMETFKPSPSLLKTLKFLLEETQNFCKEICPICKELILPKEPENLIMIDSHPRCVERVYCGHLYHQGCLKRYMQEPPFPAGGKVCPAYRKHPKFEDIFRMNLDISNSSGKQKEQQNKQRQQQQQNSSSSTSSECGIRICHDRWAINAKVAEARWAQKQARARELEEVVDFLQ